MKMIRSLIGMAAAMALVGGVQYAAGEQAQTKPTAPGQEKKAVATIESKSNSHVTGKAVFHEEGGKVTLMIEG